MTPKKIKRSAPYTFNMAVSGLSGFTEPLEEVFQSYFRNKEAWPEISSRIHEEAAACGLEIQMNPLRKITALQRLDRQELIACIKETRTRIDQLCIPLPLLDAASADYRHRQGSKPTLKEELREINQRLHYLQQLFEQNQITTPNETNPGKPERTRFEAAIASIFDDFANDAHIKAGAGRQARKDVKGHFVCDVSRVFKLRNGQSS